MVSVAPGIEEVIVVSSTLDFVSFPVLYSNSIRVVGVCSCYVKEQNSLFGSLLIFTFFAVAMVVS